MMCRFPISSPSDAPLLCIAVLFCSLLIMVSVCFVRCVCCMCLAPVVVDCLNLSGDTPVSIIFDFAGAQVCLSASEVELS